MLRRCWDILDFVLKFVMAIFLFVMMVLTASDVIARYLFDAPISGAFEVVQYLMALVVFAALPVTTASDSHLTVSLISKAMRGTIGRVHRVFVRLVSVIALVLITWRMAAESQLLASSQQVSGYLELPLAPIAAAMAALASIASIIILVKLAAALTGRDAPDEQPVSSAGFE